VCGGQPSPHSHKPRLVVSHSTCPPLSSSPHAHIFVLGTAVINNNALHLECHRNATNRSAAFYQSLKSKVGLASAKAAVLGINLNVEGWHISRPSAHSLSCSPSPPPPSFAQSPSPPSSLVRDGQTSPHRPLLVVSRSTSSVFHYPPPPSRTALS
jgi:hypothetical protein